MAYKRIQCKVLLTLFLIINTCFAGVLMEGDSLLVRENAHIEKLLMLDVTNEAMEADSILVQATDNYICNFPILKLPFFTESEIDSILLGKADTGHVHDTADVTGLHDMLAGKSDVGHDHDTSDVTNLSLYLGQKLNVTDTSDLARKVHDHSNYLTNASPYNTNDNTTPFKFTRQSNTNQEYLNIGISDLALQFNYNNDEPKGHIEWRIENTDTETGDGTNANTTVLRLLSDSSSKLLMSRNNGDYYEFWHSDNLDTANLARKIHAHTISDVTGLQDALDLKLDVTELNNYYTKTNLSTSGQSSVHWGNVTNKPTVFPPESHNHDTSDVTNLSLYLGQKLDVSDTSDLARKVHVHAISDVTNLQDALELKLDVTELNKYYTKTNLSTSGQASVHASNITNAPWINKTVSYWNTLNSDVFNIRSDDGPGIPGASTVYGGINVNIGDGYNFQIAGRNNRFFLRSEEDSTWLSWREIWHRGNLDTANIVRRNANNVFSGVNTFDDTVKAAQIKPV